MSSITSEQVIRWLERFAGLLAENKDYLTQLDAAIGDADHGANMDRGFQAVLAKKSELEGKDITTSPQDRSDDSFIHSRRSQRATLWHLFSTGLHGGRRQV